MIFWALMIPTAVVGIFGWILMEKGRTGVHWLIGAGALLIALALAIAAEVLVVWFGK